LSNALFIVTLLITCSHTSALPHEFLRPSTAFPPVVGPL
jgi:hypothetical protein